MDELKALVKKHLGTIPEVDAVILVKEGNTSHIWTILDSDDRAVENKVHEAEGKIIDEWAKPELDFHVVRGVRPIPHVSLDTMYLYQRITQWREDALYRSVLPPALLRGLLATEEGQFFSLPDLVEAAARRHIIYLTGGERMVRQLFALDPGVYNHISVEEMYDLYFHPDKMEEAIRERAKAHLEGCSSCRSRLARFYEVFPDQAEPQRSPYA